MSSIGNCFSNMSFDRFWSLDGYIRQKSPCAVIVTFLIFFSVLALFIYQLVNLFEMDTIGANKDTFFASQPPLTTINTFEANSTYSSFMMAVSILSTNNCTASTPIALEASYIVAQPSPNATTPTVTTSPIVLQTCTSQHFALLPGNIQKIRQWNNNTLACLPLNQNYLLGGSTLFGNTQRYLNFKFTCPSACGVTPNCGTVSLFTQNTNINPTSHDFSNTYFMERQSFLVANPTTYQNLYELDQSIVQTDSQIVFNKDFISKSVSTGKFHTDVPSTNTSTTTLDLRRSDKTIIYKRITLKMFDVFAYIGGITQIILIFFFFMPSFGRMLFEMEFSKELFRTRDSKDVNFISFLRQKIYNVFSGTCLQPDWEKQQRRSSINEAVSKIMNTALLQKRIAFLQQAITVLLDSHHLKGIHLVHSLTQQDVDQCQKSHKFRDRLVYYLSKYANQEANVNDRRRRSQSLDDGSSSKKQKELMKRSSVSSGKNPYINEKKLEDPQDNHATSNKMLRDTQLVDTNVENRQTESRQAAMKINKRKRGIQHEADISEQIIQQQPQPIEQLLREDKIHIEQQVDFIGKMSEEQLNQQQITEDLLNDLGRLLHEGEQATGDERSKRICRRLQSWLKKGMGAATRRYKLTHPNRMQPTFQ